MWEDLDNECFFMAPIGDEGSSERERSDGVLEFIVKPAADECGIDRTIRADSIAKPGQITLQVIEKVLSARAGVVDLTGANPNVYYEMAIRHTARLPTVLIADEAERGKLPFDLQGMRTIFFSDKSLKSANNCRNELAAHLQAALGGAVDSPVVASVNLKSLEGGGDPQGQVLASLVNTVDSLAREVRRRPVVATAPGGDQIRFLADVVEDLNEVEAAISRLTEGEDYDELRQIASTSLSRPLRYLEGFLSEQSDANLQRRARRAAAKRVVAAGVDDESPEPGEAD
jgi:hypothetical protein